MTNNNKSGIIILSDYAAKQAHSVIAFKVAWWFAPVAQSGIG